MLNVQGEQKKLAEKNLSWADCPRVHALFREATKTAIHYRLCHDHDPIVVKQIELRQYGVKTNQQRAVWTLQGHLVDPLRDTTNC